MWASADTYNGQKHHCQNPNSFVRVYVILALSFLSVAISVVAKYIAC